MLCKMGKQKDMLCRIGIGVRCRIEKIIGKRAWARFGSRILRMLCFRDRWDTHDVGAYQLGACVGRSLPLGGATVEIGEVMTASLGGRFVQFGTVECERDAESTFTHNI